MFVYWERCTCAARYSILPEANPIVALYSAFDLDQAVAAALRRRYVMKPMPAKPKIIMVQVEGSGIAGPPASNVSSAAMASALAISGEMPSANDAEAEYNGLDGSHSATSVSGLTPVISPNSTSAFR